MMKTRALLVTFMLFFALGLAGQQGCTKAPPTLSPAGVVAFQNHQVQRALDLIRDTAHDANATVPPVLSTDTARKVTLWHKSAITILHARGEGWREIVKTSLEGLERSLPDAEKAKLTPYIALAKTLLSEVF